MRNLVAGARERMADGESEAAARLLQEALAFWRGPTLAGLALESFGRDEVAQLDELRLTALMDRIDCDLAQGRHEHVLGELQVLVREHPLRERLRAQQMLALYRADRQADALDAYQQARPARRGARHRAELGAATLHKGILRQDPRRGAGGDHCKSRAASPQLGFDETRKTVTALSRPRRPGHRRGRRRGAALAGLAIRGGGRAVPTARRRHLDTDARRGQLAIFGHPTVRGRRRACCARRRRRARADRCARPRTGRRSAVGIGIHTGEVSETGGLYLASATVARVAARLEQSAQPGEVLLAEPTAKLVADVVTLGPRRRCG
jgi:hypothetical protein